MMFAKKQSILLLILWLCGTALFAQEIARHPRLVKGTLQNGLTYYIYPNDFPKGEAVYRLFIKSGSVNETEEQLGLAHFLEHMAFNGTRHFPGNELVRFLESKGAKFGRDLNAHTSYNETVYKLKLPTTGGMVDTTLTILADWLDGLLLEEEEIDAERGVILSEWLSKQKPEAEVSDVLLSELMNSSRYDKRKVIGDTAVIGHFSYATLRDYYERWYRPGLAAVAVVGDVDPVETEKMIRSKFGDMDNRKGIRAVTYPIPDYRSAEAKAVIHGDLKKTELVMVQLVPHSKPVRKEKDFYPYLQRNILNRLFRNRLNTLSFHNNGYVKGSVGLSDFLNVKGILLASVELKPDRVEEGVALFASQLNQMVRYGFQAAEIEKVKKAFLSAKERAAESVQPIASASLMEEVYADFYKDYVVTTPEEEYRLTKQYIDRIDSLSLVKMLHQLTDPARTHYLFSSFEAHRLAEPAQLLHFVDSIGKEELEPYHLAIDPPAQLLEQEPVPGSVRSVKEIPAIDGTELLLSNGVRVIYKESVSGKDRLSLSAYKKGGLYALDSTDYVSGVFAPGVVSMSGAGEFSREELSYFLAGSSASVRMLIENTRAGLVAGASAVDAETMFRLLHLKWTQPRAEQAVFELTKKKAIEDYRNKNITDQTLFYKELNELMKGSDYVTREMTDTVMEQGLQFERMVPVFQQAFGDANGFTFVIVSDMGLDVLTPYLERYIASLPASEGNGETPYRYDGGKIRTEAAQLIRAAGDSERGVVTLIFQQAEIPDEIAHFELKNDLMSGVLRMKLLTELREKMGMVYSVSVSAGSRKLPSELVRNTISFSTNPDNTALLIDRTALILQEMAAHPESFAAELENVKLSLINDMAVNVQRDTYWSSYIRNSTFNGEEEWDYISRFPDIVRGITGEELSAFVAAFYNEKNRIEAVLLPKNKDK